MRGGRPVSTGAPGQQVCLEEEPASARGCRSCLQTGHRGPPGLLPSDQRGGQELALASGRSLGPFTSADNSPAAAASTVSLAEPSLVLTAPGQWAQ